ncbi:MAG: DNA-3-methyladenine glycosylase I [Hyphomicrobiaceae bacterium]|nr:DNA-3-methyladenine glycosylase I [Hyphomicrobiaceae bacterium]
MSKSSEQPLRCPPRRCPWVGKPQIYVDYHDKEWGVPIGDDRTLFQKLVLEGFQAGLSWITILKKRERFVEVLDGFDPEKIVHYDGAKIAELMADAGIIRHRAKIEATISNARAYLDLAEQQSLGAFFWGFVDGQTIDNKIVHMKEVPGKTVLSEKISKVLKQKGFRFCGPVGIYALMQSAGLVNDHLVDCHRYEPCRKLAKQFSAPVR